VPLFGVQRVLVAHTCGPYTEQSVASDRGRKIVPGMLLACQGRIAQ